jgi:replicative DNA helicase
MRQAVRNSWKPILSGMTPLAKQFVNGEPSYVCPLCKHGENGDGLTYNPRSADGNGLKCFGCGFSGDIIDLYQKQTGANFPTALSFLAQEIGITSDPYSPSETTDFAAETYTPPQDDTQQSDFSELRHTEETSQNISPSKSVSFSAYYRKCQERLTDPVAVSYLKSRGISIETAKQHLLGFDPAADPANAPGAMGDEYKPHPAPRIIIPTCDGHYIGRSVDPNTLAKYAKMNPKRDMGASSPGIFNGHALYAPGIQEVFVTEGAFDALSISEVGASAIALNSTSNVDLLVEQLELRKTEATLVLCLDNDASGRQATNTLAQHLQRLNVNYISVDICEGYKDPNEALIANRYAFSETIKQVRRTTSLRPDSTSHFIDYQMRIEIERFQKVIKTGFSNLDSLIGGLYSGLYVVAAISSLGKTTFCSQLADQIAVAGTDVLFFSLEQTRLELVSKSIARTAAQNNLNTTVTSLSIRQGDSSPQVLEAICQYKQAVQNRVSIIEGNLDCTVSFISDTIRQYIKMTNTHPIIFIDYLQILKPEKIGNRIQTTKESVDQTVAELKSLSTKLGLTIFVICSVNRANYMTPIDFESLKESGGIEYTADVIWGLQLQCLNEELFNEKDKAKLKRDRIKKAKSETPRKLELACLKNRFGAASFEKPCLFDYYPRNDFFKPSSSNDATFSQGQAQTNSAKMRKRYQ